MTPTYPELGDKRKWFEKSEKIRKKRKDDKKNGIIGLTNDDYNLISYQMQEVVSPSCKNMDEQHTEMVRNITYLL